ncbi:hypothetical protein GCM10022381_42100 [Leifsonia kafniensis]|uniref:Uncharacterized protein n=1 Tax=Leifsonia kafniensis TaxID=475957 RepID=A0ABP7L782_9MICO
MKALAAAIVSTALIASTFIATAGPADPASAAGAADGTVSGTVFQNFDSSGWKASAKTGVVDSLPVAGVTATAYDAQGDIVGSGVSATDGRYTMTVDDAFSDALRVQFSGWSEPLEPAFAAQGTSPQTGAAANDTSVQFVTLNAANAATGVDFGLIDPDQVAQANAPIATAVQSAGGLAASKLLPAVVAQPWQLSGEDVAPSKISTVAKFGATGSIWGMAYAPQSNDLFVAASLKRMSDLGPLGLGGIYRTPGILSANGSANTTATTTGWLNLSGLPVSNAGGVPLDIGESLIPTTADRKLTTAITPLREIPVFKESGRVGIGALATSPDGSRLFATNLRDGDVYAVDISNPQVAPTSTYRIETLVSATQAIWAVEVHKDRLYIGYVDTGDTAARATDPGKSAASKGMKAYVASTPIAGVLNAPSAAPGWTTELTIDLGYAKGSNIANWAAQSDAKIPPKFEAKFPQLKQWNSWTDEWSWGSGATAGAVAMEGDTVDVNLHAYPQAILSSIAFDADGYLNLGFLDRTSVQSGNRSYGAVTGTDKTLWTTISNGDVLAAAPVELSGAAAQGCPATVPGERYVLECAGKVGDRAVRTTTTTPTSTNPVGQTPTFNNLQGPGGGEFFNDRRELGTEAGTTNTAIKIENHNENALGSVTSYPGSREVATTAMDPLSTAYRTGIMWFDERTGAATRGIDLVAKGATRGSTSFQKSGGLGGTALLALAAPVEIGNRVWLDADLNGRQDADEPAINGAVVELWTADVEGKPADKIATRTTATVDGQAGTYYFRTDDPDVTAATNAHPFVANASYVLVFPAGSGKVSLAGPNAGNAGFAGLTWNDLQRTTADVRVAATATNGGTTELNDSNPNVATGRSAVAVGDPGQNNHTYDAGWSSANNYELAKSFNPSNIVVPAGTSYTFNVIGAKNFRGEDRLASGGPSVPSDPQVSETEMTLTTPNWMRTSTVALPLGYQLVLQEKNAVAESVTWNAPVAGNTAQGTVTITPKRGALASARITATNQFGSFTVKKTVSGPASTRVPADTKFQIEYALDGKAAKTAWVSKNTPFVLGNLALGTTVKLKESNPIVTDPAVVQGVTWGTPTWASAPGVTGPDAAGWYSFTLTAADRNLELSLNNDAKTVTGGFSILKARAAGEPEPNKTFSFQYKVDVAGTPVALGPIKAGQTASTPLTIIGGSTVFVREIAPNNSSTVEWAAPVWSGLPDGATGPDADGWYSFTFNPKPAAPLVLTALNQGIQRYGKFTFEKQMDITGTPDVADKKYLFKYRTAPPTDGTAPVFGTSTVIELSAGERWPALGLDPMELPVGTIVELLEARLDNKPGISWKTPSWTVNGDPATVVNGWTRFTIKPFATEGVQALVVTNHVEETVGFTLRKAFVGTGVDKVTARGYPVEVEIGADPVQSFDLAGNGDAWEHPAVLPEGTIVRVRELTPPAVTGIEWGDPMWTNGAGDVLTQDGAGWVEFAIGDATQSAELTLTNAPSLLGRFTVKKTLVKTGNPVVPPDYTVDYELDGVAQTPIVLAAGATSRVIGDLPLGTVVKVHERAPDAVSGVEWASAWTIDGAKATPDSDGWVTFTIADTTTPVAFEVKNTATTLYGQFQVAKTVTGDGASLVPDDTPFIFEYTLNGGTRQRVTATPATASEFIGGLQYGTVVAIEEVLFPKIQGISFNEKPGWRLNGASVASPVTFTIDGTDLVELSVDNTATPVKGSFELTKVLTGTAVDRIPDDASFTVEYSIDDGGTWLPLDLITKTHLTVVSPEFIEGTAVLVREVAPTDGVAFEWKDPEFFVDGASQGTSAHLIITKDAVGPAIKVKLNNPSLPLNGTFDVAKRVTGDFALTAPELAKRTFTAKWSGGGRTGSIALNAANGWTNGPGGAPFPVGTVITLTEGAVTGLPANVRFDGYSWLKDVPGVTVSANGKTATLTVATGDPAHLVLINEFPELKGTFNVEKIVDGAFKLTDAELKGLTFTVKYTTSTGVSGSLALNNAGDWKAAAGRMFPTGTKVTLTEVAVAQSSLSPHVKWDGYTWMPGSGYTVSKDGQRASVVIGNDTNLALTVRNSFSELKGSFAVQKLVEGDFELTDRELRAQTFAVEYSTSTGKSGTLDLNAKNGWSAVAGKLPAGTTVTLTEVTPAKLAPNVTWDEHRWMSAAGVTISKDGHMASFTVSADEPVVRLALKNTFTELTNSFSVQKVVTGDFALTSPELAGLTFAVPYTASNGAKGSLELNAAGEWAAATGEEFPIGTKIAVTEADVSGLPAHVQWADYAWLDGNGYTVSNDKKTASFTITEIGEPKLKLTLQNSFTELLGGFSLTKKVTGAAAKLVPGNLKFTAEFSLDGGASWKALPAVTKSKPSVNGPGDIKLGATVLIRETTPDTVPGVSWGAPVFSGTGITPGLAGAPASFVVGSTDTPVKVVLTNPTNPQNGQFQVTKKITGAGESLLKGDPRFTMKYSYDGQKTPGKFSIKAGEFASSEPIRSGTVVTITEVLPEDGLVDGASWGTPVFVRADGTVLQNGATITIGTDTVIALQLENPTRAELAHTGSDVLGIGILLMTLLGGVGGWLLLIERRRRRSYGPMRS